MSRSIPSMDAWLREAKAHESAPLCGMYLTHNGTVRQTAKAKVRYGAEDTKEVTGMLFSYDAEKVSAVIADAYKLDGIYYIKVWLNEGELAMGDDIMYVLIGGDIRPRVVDALHYLVGRIKNECVVETELKPKGMGVWAAKRIQVCMEGEDADVEAIYHRYFIQFLSTGG